MSTRLRELLTVDALRQVPEHVDLPLNARLRERVVVLDAVEQVGRAPESVGLDFLPHLVAQRGNFEGGDVRLVVCGAACFKIG